MYNFPKISWWTMPPNHPSKVHGNTQIHTTGKRLLALPTKSRIRPCEEIMASCYIHYYRDGSIMYYHKKISYL